ncbi:MAG: 50S ribosomal protein L6 [Gammaproteobacteria bacterium]|nr:50S ribosomal protein L6 [Gammaproteobacteria bacterium]
MAKSSNRTVQVPEGVDVAVNASSVTVKGQHGELSLDVKGGVDISRENGELTVTPRSKARSEFALAGTYQALLRNMVHGVTERWEKQLEIQGTGYRARAEKNNLNLMLGYSQPIDFPIPEGVEIATPTQTSIVVSGIDRQQVGQVAAEIRSLRPPEPYKGKGVRYLNEYVRRKEGKKK